MNLYNYFYKTMKSVVSIKMKNMPLAYLIQKIKSQWLFKNIYNKEEQAYSGVQSRLLGD